MKVMLYKPNESIGMMQGEAIERIHKATTGALESAGEVINEQGGQTGLLYVKKTYSKGKVTQSESIWLDTGISLACLHRRVNAEPWEQKTDGVWQPVELEIEFITLADAQAAQRIDNDLDRALGLLSH